MPTIAPAAGRPVVTHPAAPDNRASVTSSLGEEEWSTFVREAAGGNIFLTPPMAEVMGAVPGQRPAAHAVRREGEIVALTVTVSVRSGPSIAGLAASRSIGYGGVAIGPGERDREAAAQLMAAYRPPPGTLFTELRHLHGAPDLRIPLQTAGYAWRPHLDFVIDLAAGPEALFAGLGPRTRKHLRRALRRGTVRVVEVTTDGQLADWYRLLQATYRHVRVPLADRRLFEAARSVLGPHRMARFTLALIGDSAAACAVELYFGERVYLWYSGVDRAFSAELPNHVLTWEHLRWSAEAGYRLYDWGGAGEPGRPYGVRDHKAHFGGQLVNPGRSIRVHHRLGLAVADLAYRRLYQSRGRQPTR